MHIFFKSKQIICLFYGSFRHNTVLKCKQNNFVFKTAYLWSSKHNNEKKTFLLSSVNETIQLQALTSLYFSTNLVWLE